MPENGPSDAKLAGLPWDEQRFHSDPAYNKAIGMAHFQKNLQDNGGDIAKSMAAYNAGQGWVDKAVARAAKAEPGTQEADWFWQLNNDARTPSTRDAITASYKRSGIDKPTEAQILSAYWNIQTRRKPRYGNRFGAGVGGAGD
jgi:hypothetical protein